MRPETRAGAWVVVLAQAFALDRADQAVRQAGGLFLVAKSP